MATQIKSNTLVPTHGHERVVLVDDFGKEHHVYISFADIARRDEILTAEKAALDAHVDMLRDYAAKTGAALP